MYYYSTFPWPLVMCVLLSCIIKFFDLGCSIKMAQKLKIHTNYLQSLILLLLKMIFGFVVVVHLVVIFVVNKAKFSILFSSLYLI